MSGYDLVTDSPTKRIYEAVKRIPKGHVATYGKIAEMAGEPRMARAVAERICNYPEVSAVYLISGDFDMMVLIEGKTLQEVSKFVSSKLSPIEDVTGTSTQFVLKKYKDHGTIMFGQKKPERMLITP